MDGMGQGVEIKASLWLRDAVCVWGGVLALSRVGGRWLQKEVVALW